MNDQNEYLDILDKLEDLKIKGKNITLKLKLMTFIF